MKIADWEGEGRRRAGGRRTEGLQKGTKDAKGEGGRLKMENGKWKIEDCGLGKDLNNKETKKRRGLGSED